MSYQDWVNMVSQRFITYATKGFWVAALTILLSAMVSPVHAATALRMDDRDIVSELEAIEGLQVVEIVSTSEGYRAFSLNYRQPVDHAKPWGESFFQRILLLHRGFDAPTEMITGGYGIGRLDSAGAGGTLESLQANFLSVEHRYFGKSQPESRDWSHLTIKQAATDIHRIVEAIRPIYSAPWFTSGGSKSGMTALYHRRFYPDDVDGTVALVAPNTFGRLDRRYTRFLNEVGSAWCRSRLRTFQRELLQRRESIVKLLAEWSEATGSTFDLLEGGLDQALDIAVSEFYYSFWQYSDQSQCKYVPRRNASDEDLFQALHDSFVLQATATDQALKDFQPYYVQAVRQLGYPRLNTSHLRDLLMYDPNDYSPYLLGEPFGHFDWKAMLDIYLWVAFEAENVILIYGENDPWTAGAFGLANGKDRDAHKYTIPRGNHTVWLTDLKNDALREAISTLESWTGATWIEVSHESRSRREFWPSTNWREPLSPADRQAQEEYIMQRRQGL